MSDLVDDYLERRTAFREEHLRLAREAQARGDLRFAGAFADPVNGAALVFTTADRSVAGQFARNDPHVRDGLVKEWRVRRWNVVIGGQ